MHGRCTYNTDVVTRSIEENAEASDCKREIANAMHPSIRVRGPSTNYVRFRGWVGGTIKIVCVQGLNNLLNNKALR